MATPNPVPTQPLIAKAAGQRLLIDTNRLTVRRLTKSEGSILSALKSLAPVERATLATLVEAMQAKKKRHSQFAEALAAN